MKFLDYQPPQPNNNQNNQPHQFFNSITPNQQIEPDPIEQGKKDNTKEALKGLYPYLFGFIAIILLGTIILPLILHLFSFILGTMNGFSGMIGKGSNSLERMFLKARFLPPNAEFIQLIAIAVFVGWASRRILNMSKRTKRNK